MPGIDEAETKLGNQGWSACGEGGRSGQAAFYPSLAARPGAVSPSDPQISLTAMARPAEGSRVSRNRFGESQLLEGSQNSLPATCRVARLSSANFSHRITKAKLGNNLSRAPLGWPDLSSSHARSSDPRISGTG